jgi:hypothetical protein
MPAQWGGTPNVLNMAEGSIPGLYNYNLYGQNIPQYSGIAQGLVNNPYAQQYQAGASQAVPYTTAAALNQFGAGGNLLGGGNAILNTAFDPQQQLYNYLYNQNQQQAEAVNTQAGVGTTPYGAGLVNQADQLFNLNWQNQQLARQQAGLGAAGQAYGQGAQLQQQAPLSYLQGQALPYSTFGNIGQQQLGALGGLGQFGQSASTLPQQVISDYSQLGGQGGQYSFNAGQLGLNQANAYYNQMAGAARGIGYGLSGLSNYGTGWGGGGWGNPQVAGAYGGGPIGGAFSPPQNTGYGGMGGWA